MELDRVRGIINDSEHKGIVPKNQRNNDVSKEQLMKNAINLIKSPKLDTQIAFKLLKRRDNDMSIKDIL